MPTSRSQLKVLVIDDSAVVRQVMSSLLSQERDLHVSVAADPLFAMEKMRRQRPDVILLDLEMPRMHGLTFLNKLMAEDPIPVVVCSAVTESGDSIAIAALEAGAVAVIAKPKLGVREFLYESAVMLIDTVISAAHAKVRSRKKPAPFVPAKRKFANTPLHANVLASDKIIAIGASTGGPEAISGILEQLDVSCPPVVVVQHMPEGFTAAYAKRLDGLCRIRVKECEPGDRLARGMAVIAPGNRHMSVQQVNGTYCLVLGNDALVNRHRPSVDVLFHSLAKVARANALGVLLTGMGNDGAQGLLHMREAGSHTIAQDEDSSVVFGMPKEAIAAGAACSVLPLNRMPTAIHHWISS